MPIDFEALRPLVQKKISSTPPMLPSFYMCPYSDSKPGDPFDYSLIHRPSAELAYDVNIAFFTVDDDKDAGTYGNGISYQFLTHLRNLSAIKQVARKLEEVGRRLYVSFIDTPSIHWDSVNVANFVRNTEGEFDADGLLITNDLMDDFNPVGRMWDIETEDTAALAMAKVMKACFLQGMLRDPEHYVFIYTTYANRPIDETILSSLIDPEGDFVDQSLYQLGFRQFSDLITMRGSLSILETMSYGSSSSERFSEADAYALQLAKGDESKRNDMRKFISIGVAPGLTDPRDALTIAAACDPTLSEGYGRFMVWGGNCPAGVELFESMAAVRQRHVLSTDELKVKEMASKRLDIVKAAGNYGYFFASSNASNPAPGEESLHPSKCIVM